MICFNNTDHGHAIAALCGCKFNPPDDQVISRETDGVLRGGALYTDYRRASIVGHFAGFDKHWGSRDLLWVGFDYPFNQLGCSKIIGFVPSMFETALALELKLGFKYLTKIPGVFPDGDLIVVVMERADCRWLNIKPRSLTRGSLLHG